MNEMRKLMEAIKEANQGGKTEHSGAKKGKGAYYGRKKDAKQDSRKNRRKADKAATKQINEYGSNDFPENMTELTLGVGSMKGPEEDGSGNAEDWFMEVIGDYSSVDWKSEPEHVLAEVAEQIAQYGLGVELLDAGDDQCHFNIKKWS